MICINCPVGCRLTATIADNQVLSVEGNTCKRGEDFARQEAIEPLRVLTSLMRIQGREKPFSVKTSAPVPKKILFDCVKEIFEHPVDASKLPIHTGDIILSNVCKSGVDIISTQDVIS